MGFSDIYDTVPQIVWIIMSYGGTACAMLFLYFSSKYHNIELKIKWYICAFLFPFITSMVYISKSKEYKKNAGMKVCPCCGGRYPVNFQICSRCLIELPEFDKAKSDKNKKLSKIFLCIFVLVFAMNFAVASIGIGGSLKDWSAELDEITAAFEEYPERISLENADGDSVYYDRNGEENYDNLDLPLYDKEGNMYYFVMDEGIIGFYKDDENKDWNDANFFLNKYSFVDEEGYFVYFYDEEPVKIVEDENAEYEYYFETPYTDGKGNFYYPAISASWNEKGELITSAEQIK